MEKIFIQNVNGGDLKIAAHVYFPNNFDPTQRYPAIVVSHPGGGVKEQASGLYAQKLAAAANFITIAYDASFQGEARAYHANWKTHMSEPKTSAPSLII